MDLQFIQYFVIWGLFESIRTFVTASDHSARSPAEISIQVCTEHVVHSYYSLVRHDPEHFEQFSFGEWRVVGSVGGGMLQRDSD